MAFPGKDTDVREDSELPQVEKLVISRANTQIHLADLPHPLLLALPLRLPGDYLTVRSKIRKRKV